MGLRRLVGVAVTGRSTVTPLTVLGAVGRLSTVALLAAVTLLRAVARLVTV